MLTILNVAYPFAPVGRDSVGGAEQVLSALEQAVHEAGHRSLVLACAGSKTRGELALAPHTSSPATPEERAIVYGALKNAIEGLVAREHVDLVHLHGIDFLNYLPQLEIPVLATLHLPPAWYPVELFAKRRSNLWLNCVSESQQRDCPPCPAVLGAIPNGVDLEAFRPVEKRDGFALVLARICPEKGIHCALEAADRAGVDLVLAGSVFPYPEHERYYAEEILPSLDANKRFVGPLDLERKAALLATARCVLVPSLIAETSSLVAMEALASGTPVVGFRRGALPELVVDGHTGFLVRDVEAMAHGIRASGALDGRLCRLQAEQRCSSTSMTDRYLDLYSRLAEGRVPRPATDKLEIDELCEQQELELLRTEWLELWERCPEASVFQRPEWLLAWCTHLLREDSELRVLTFRRAGRLVGLAPLFRWVTRSAPVLSPMGAGVSDYLDVLFESRHRLGVTTALETWLRESGDWERCECSELRSFSPLLELSRRFGATASDIHDMCPGTRMGREAPASQIVPKQTWARISYARRRLGREATVQYEEAGPDNFDQFFTQLEVLHSARFQSRGQRGMLSDQATRAFHREAGRRLLRAGKLALYALRIDGELAAVLHGFRDRTAFRYYLGGFDQKHARHSPGMLLIAHALEQAHREGAEWFDFLRGREPYKYSWGATDARPLYRASWQHPS